MTKGKILQSIWDNLPDERKQRIQALTKELEAEYLTLQELRKAVGLTQAEVSRSLLSSAIECVTSGKRV